jgi:hypothetical protein
MLEQQKKLVRQFIEAFDRERSPTLEFRRAQSKALRGTGTSRIWGESEVHKACLNINAYLRERAQFLWEKIQEVVGATGVVGNDSLASDLKAVFREHMCPIIERAHKEFEDIRERGNVGSGWTAEAIAYAETMLAQIDAKIDLFCAKLIVVGKTNAQSHNSDVIQPSRSKILLKLVFVFLGEGAIVCWMLSERVTRAFPRFGEFLLCVAAISLLAYAVHEIVSRESFKLHFSKFESVIWVIFFAGAVAVVFIFVITNPKPEPAPALSIRIQENLGLTVRGGEITSEMTKLYREHFLILKNENRVDLRNFDLWVRLPEPVADRIPTGIHLRQDVPPGVNVKFERADAAMSALTANGGSVSMPQQPPTIQWALKIDVLPALKFISIPFLTVPGSNFVGMPMPSKGFPPKPVFGPLYTDTNSGILMNYIMGEFQYSTPSNRWETQSVVTAIVFNPTNRTMHSLPPENTFTNWKMINRSYGFGF